LFLVIEGELDMEFRDRTEVLCQGDLIVVPKGTEHLPCARKGEVKLFVIDADGTPNTGDEATAFKPIEV
jgi:mannose-6-phosphate isomerase-like protein (cupin superfamily)